MLRIYADPESPNEGACLRHMMNRNRQMTGQFKSLRYVMNWNRQMMGRESPNEGARLRYMFN